MTDDYFANMYSINPLLLDPWEICQFSHLRVGLFLFQNEASSPNKAVPDFGKSPKVSYFH